MPHQLNLNAVSKYTYGAPPIVVGCDPGPTHCAFVALKLSPEAPGLVDAECLGAEYLPNSVIESTLYGRNSFPSLQGHAVDVFAYEQVACQGCLVGKTVFDTCSMSGVLRRIFRCEANARKIVAFTPSDWRYITCGRGNAKDSETRMALKDYGVKGLEEEINKAAKAVRATLSKPCTPHLRDAAGVAIAVAIVNYRLGDGELERRFV